MRTEERTPVPPLFTVPGAQTPAPKNRGLSLQSCLTRCVDPIENFGLEFFLNSSGNSRMNLIDALEALMCSIEYRDTTDIEVPEAAGMMGFAAGVLGLDCPSFVPTICIDQGIEEKTAGTFVFSLKLITLKLYDGEAFYQGVLVHELAHWVQCFNGRPYCEKEAITAQCRWLQKIGAGQEAYPVRKAILRMTGGDREFARMKWLVAA